MRRALFINNPLNSLFLARIIWNFPKNFLKYKQITLSLHIFRNIKFIRHFFTPNREKQRIDRYWFVIEYYKILIMFIVFKLLFGISNEYWMKIRKIWSIACNTYRKIAIHVFWNIDVRLFKKYLLHFFSVIIMLD